MGPNLPSLQKSPLSPHLAFLGPLVCHTNSSVTLAGRPGWAESVLQWRLPVANWRWV